MLNITILALTAGNILSNSPFIAFRDNARFGRCLFTRMLSPALFSDHLNHLIAEHTSFTKLLGGAIHLAERDFNNERFTSHQDVTDYSASVSIRSCLFIDISSPLEEGGGIHINARSASVDIIQTGFTNCNSNKKGGAFSVYGRKISVDRSCISMCSASDCDAFFFETAAIAQGSNDEISKTYVYRISPRGSSTTAIYFDSLSPYVQTNNFTQIQRTSVKTAIEFTEFNSFTMKYNVIADCVGTSSLYFANFPTDVSIQYTNFVGNRASDSLVHITEKYGKFNHCYFQNDNSNIYCNVYSRFEDCVFGGPLDKDKFPNNDYTVRCTFNRVETVDIDIPLESKNGCWALISPSSGPTSQQSSSGTQASGTPIIVPTTDGSAAKRTITATLVITVALLIIAICIVGYFAIKWWRGRRSSERNLMMMYAQV